MKFRLSIITLLFSFFALAQSGETGANVLYSKAIEITASISEALYDQYYSGDVEQSEAAAKSIIKIKKEALVVYTELHTNFPDYYKEQILSKKGSLEFDVKNYNDSKETLLKLIDSRKDDEHYFKCYNQAYRILASISIQEKNYQLAKNYLDSSQECKVYYSCGNERIGKESQLRHLYDQCEKGLAQQQTTKN